jgi:hypothetical protein
LWNNKQQHRHDLCNKRNTIWYPDPPSHRAWRAVDEVDSQATPNPNNNPFCFRKIRATRHREGVSGNVSVDVTVVDRCTGCKVYDLDFSPSAFDKMADEALGRVDVTWEFLD